MHLLRLAFWPKMYILQRFPWTAMECVFFISWMSVKYILVNGIQFNSEISLLTFWLDVGQLVRVGKSAILTISVQTSVLLCSVLFVLWNWMSYLKLLQLFDELPPLVVCGNPNRASLPETVFRLLHSQRHKRQALSLFMSRRDFVTECRLK